MNRGIDAFEIAIALRFHTMFRYYGAAESCQIKQHYIPKAKEEQKTSLVFDSLGLNRK